MTVFMERYFRGWEWKNQRTSPKDVPVVKFAGKQWQIRAVKG